MAEEKKKPRTVYIQPTTGGQVEIKIAQDSTVNNLKRVVANRLKVCKDRIVLLHKNRQLVEGTLQDNHVTEGSKLTLLPSVETGIASQRPEQCVMQALESLNDSQVDNFLAGRAPLNLTMRLGDHMMFIQLQLSTVAPSKGNTSNSSTTATTTSNLPTPPTTPTTPNSPTSPLQFPSSTVTSNQSSPLSPPPSPKQTAPPADAEDVPVRSSVNAKVLAEASRNLTHTLRQLSSAALNKKMNERCDGRCCSMRRQGGAVIESMFHHGRGIYSGTFSGTLSPSLQDKDGRPRRDVSTVIHILNDLLGASSHCRPSAQCLCSTSSAATTSRASQPSDSQPVSSLQVKVDGHQKQEENKMLRQKMEQIQTMLEERRQKRKARRSMPYCATSKSEKASATLCQTTISGSTPMETDCSDKTMADYSSETAVA